MLVLVAHFPPSTCIFGATILKRPLNNFLSDIPAMTIASDNVDREMVERPRRWNISFIRNFMIVFGLISSSFDYLTFGVLLFVVRATPEQFRTGWFIESLLTELVIIFVVRTYQPLFRSRPGKYLMMTTLMVFVIALVLPMLPFAQMLGFTPLPFWVIAMLLGITVLYVAVSEVAKSIFAKQWMLAR